MVIVDDMQAGALFIRSTCPGSNRTSRGLATGSRPFHGAARGGNAAGSRGHFEGQAARPRFGFCFVLTYSL